MQFSSFCQSNWGTSLRSCCHPSTNLNIFPLHHSCILYYQGLILDYLQTKEYHTARGFCWSARCDRQLPAVFHLEFWLDPSVLFNGAGLCWDKSFLCFCFSYYLVTVRGGFYLEIFYLWVFITCCFFVESHIF